MGKVSMGLSMSLDGFIAGPNDGPTALRYAIEHQVKEQRTHYLSIKKSAQAGYQEGDRP